MPSFNFLTQRCLKNCCWKQSCWILVFIAPLWLWHVTTDISDYFYYGAPAGQIWYVFSKLLGLYAILLLWFQICSTLLRDYSVFFPKWRLFHHRNQGNLTLLLIIGHIFCFVMAASLRKGSLAWDVLHIDFQADYYRRAVSLGNLAFWIACIAVLGALWRKRLPTVWKFIHRGMLLVMMLGMIHGLLIGTETRYSWYQVFYYILVVTYLLSLLLRLYNSRKVNIRIF